MHGEKDHTELPGEIHPTTNYGGLSEVLNSEDAKEVKRELQSIASVATPSGASTRPTSSSGAAQEQGSREAGPAAEGRAQVSRSGPARSTPAGVRATAGATAPAPVDPGGRGIGRQRVTGARAVGRATGTARVRAVASDASSSATSSSRPRAGSRLSRCGAWSWPTRARSAPATRAKRSATLSSAAASLSRGNRRERDRIERLPRRHDNRKPARRGLRRAAGEDLALPDERRADDRGQLPVSLWRRRVAEAGEPEAGMAGAALVWLYASMRGHLAVAAVSLAACSGSHPPLRQPPPAGAPCGGA